MVEYEYRVVAPYSAILQDKLIVESQQPRRLPLRTGVGAPPSAWRQMG
ncbi:hypothetical protein [Cupriavidus sp. BIC8F]|nr:hypothetical protein [Cupriavidus sp. BIC8F]